MARSTQRILRHAPDGVTWKVTPTGSRLAIEIVFDDEPDRVIAREVILAPHERATGLASLVAEQLADGFVLEPPWTPTPEWIRSAAPDELVIEVVDEWFLALCADSALFRGMPASVRSLLALHTMAVQASRNGLSSFLREDDPQLTTHVPEAARHLALPEIEALFARATQGLDLVSLARTGAGPVRWGDRRAAKTLESALTALDFQDRLLAWVREHADDFAKVATLGAT